MNKFKIRSKDKVVVVAGKDKGKRGEVIKLFPKAGKAIVSGANIAKKHMKPSKLNPNGGIVEKEMPIDISNLLLVDPKTDMPTRVGYKMMPDGKKVRYAKKSGEIIDNLQS